MKAIHIRDLHFSYQGEARGVFEEFSLALNFEEGSVIALMGPSGTGKTTLLKLFAGIEQPSRGEIWISKEAPFFAFMPQAPVLFEHLSILDNAKLFAILGATRCRFDNSLFSRVAGALRIDGLLGRKGSVYDLSGGERQRLALLRALSVRPDFLLLDEPCSGMDAEVKQEFLVTLRELLNREKIPTIYVTHHPDEVAIIADQVAYLTTDSSGVVARCSLQPVNKFFEEPLTLRAALVVGYPSASIVRYRRNSVGRAGGFLIVKPENVVLSTEDGVTAEVIAGNPIFVALRIDGLDGAVMVRSDSLVANQSSYKATFRGSLRWYDEDGNFCGLEKLDPLLGVRT